MVMVDDATRRFDKEMRRLVRAYAKPETAEKEKARLARRRSRAGESRLAEKGKCCLVSRIDAIG